MKKLFLFLFFSLFLFWCSREVGLISSENSLEDIEINDTEINDKIMIIQQKLMNWELTQEQAQDLTQNIWNYSTDYIHWLQKNEILLKIVWLPKWVEDLWIYEPEWMILDQDYSQITSIDNENEGFDSVLMVYRWDYQKSLIEAARIAQRAKLPISKDFQEAKEIQANSPDILEQMWDETKDSMEWIIYANYSITDMDKDYIISVSVEKDWTLIINVSNYSQMKSAMKN